MNRFLKDDKAQSNYGQMIYPMLFMLFFVNAMFLFTMGMPKYQANSDQNLDIGLGGIGGSTYNNIYGQSSGFLTDTNIITGAPTSDNNIEPFSGTRNYPESQKSWIFGNPVTAGLAAVGMFGTVLNYFVGLAFGYWFWVDYFLRPEWGLALIGLPIKFFFFFVQLYGMFLPILNVFGLGLGSRGG